MHKRQITEKAVLALLWFAIFPNILTACTDDGDLNDDESSGGDSDTDTDADGDADTEFIGPPSCENYPPSDDNFSNDSVVSNYQFYNKDNDIVQMCDFIEGNRLLLIKITRDLCIACQLEIELIAALAAEHADEGVVIMEANQAISSQSELQDWVLDWDYFGLRNDPPKQLEYDYRKTELMPDFGVYTLIDLTTMKVKVSNCGTQFAAAKECLLSNM